MGNRDISVAAATAAAAGGRLGGGGAGGGDGGGGGEKEEEEERRMRIQMASLTLGIKQLWRKVGTLLLREKKGRKKEVPE